MPKIPRPVRVLVRWSARLVVGCVLVVATLLLVQAFADRRFADLEPWQKNGPDSEFRASDANGSYQFDDYLKNEHEVFREVDGYMRSGDPAADRASLMRYVKGSRSDPSMFSPNWNRTTILEPTEVRGGAVLLHGLSDSPYSMRSLAEMFQAQGVCAVSLRIPGHGTVPAGLLSVSWKDWMAATRLAVQHVRDRIGPDKPLFICGYSNGGALAVLYALQAAQRGEPAPTGVFLFSPAIAVTAFARASNWHMLYSWIPYFEKSKWLSVEPEYDPYKYCSFTKNAGAQVWQLTQEIQREFARATADRRWKDLPPIMTFQSAVDATIIADDVVRLLYDRLPANGSELVVFDVNRTSVLDGFYRQRGSAVERLLRVAPVKYGVTVVQNENEQSQAMVARIRPAGASESTTQPLGVTWPGSVYSLAHVAIPFPPDDPVYGDAANQAGEAHVRLGDLSLRGERNVLVVSAADMLRLRHNPFHAYMLERMREVIAHDLAAP